MLKLLTRTSIVLAMLPALASAQSVALPIEGVHRTQHSEQAPAMTEERRTVSFTPAEQNAVLSRRRDSLWNGVIVGAGLGALVGIAGSPLISDCSECAGFNVPLTFGGTGSRHRRCRRCRHRRHAQHERTSSSSRAASACVVEGRAWTAGLDPILRNWARSLLPNRYVALS